MAEAVVVKTNQEGTSSVLSTHDSPRGRLPRGGHKPRPMGKTIAVKENGSEKFPLNSPGLGPRRGTRTRRPPKRLGH